MTQQHPITPPPELVQEWWEEADQYQDDPKTYFDHVATQAAQWGADQELEACLKHMCRCGFSDADILHLRATRRPNPPSLKEQALAELEEIMTELHDETGSAFTASAIRRALEALDE